MLRLPVVVAVALVCAPLAAQEADLSLFVRGGDTGGPVPGAVVEILGVQGTVDAFGQASLSGVPVGEVPIGVAFPGYVPLDTTVVVVAGDPNLTILTLVPDRVLLAEAVVEEDAVNDEVLRRRGFFDRRETQTGVFLTREELDRRGVHLMSDVFSSVAGVRVQRVGGQRALVSQRRNGCRMTVYLDGTEMAYIAENIDALPFDDVAAIEIYRGPSELPIEYAHTKTGGTCGAVLVWTRILASND